MVFRRFHRRVAEAHFLRVSTPVRVGESLWLGGTPMKNVWFHGFFFMSLYEDFLIGIRIYTYTHTHNTPPPEIPELSLSICWYFQYKTYYYVVQHVCFIYTQPLKYSTTWLHFFWKKHCSFIFSCNSISNRGFALQLMELQVKTFPTSQYFAQKSVDLRNKDWGWTNRDQLNNQHDDFFHVRTYTKNSSHQFSNCSIYQFNCDLWLTICSSTYRNTLCFNHLPIGSMVLLYMLT